VPAPAEEVLVVVVEVAGRVATVTLDDPERRNVVSTALNRALWEAFDDLEGRHDVGAVVLTGAGRAFCAGADLADLAACRDEATLRGISAGFLRVGASPLPTVAAVNGPAVGAGLNMALACDVVVAAESARFDSRFLQLGAHPGGGSTWRLRRTTDLQATMAMVVFGEVVSGRRAEEIGLAWSCVPDAELLDAARTMAARAADAPTELVRRTKATVLATDAISSSDAAVDLEVGPQLWSFGRPEFGHLLAQVRARLGTER
jgi:enoyl-CoA hydratase